MIMKRYLLVLLLPLFTLCANADDPVEIEGIYYYLESNPNVAEVTSNPNYYSGEVAIPKTVTYDGKEYSVTSIGDCAFQDCYDLTSVIIPNSVTSIGTMAFKNCNNLSSVNIPNSVTSIDWCVFMNCKSLASITIPNSVTSIGLGAFDGCENLTSITIPNSLTSIAEFVFHSCGLTSVTIPNSVTSIGDAAFEYCPLTSIIIGSGVISITHSFIGCQELTDVYCLAENVPRTSSDAFDGSYIEYATLHVPKGSIDSYKAVEPWKNFKAIIEMEPSSVRTFDVETAGTLSAILLENEVDPLEITGLTLTGELNGDDLLFIREMAGSDVNGVPTDGKLQNLDLSGATIVEGGTYIDLEGDCIYLDKDKTQALYGFDEGEKASVANTLGDFLFAGCQQLKSVKTPANLVKIGERVFEGSGLTSIDLNSGLTTIDPCAFWFSLLSSITIPNTVTHIGDSYWVDNPFAYISTLTTITLEEENSRYSMSDGGKLLIDNDKDAVVCALGNEAIPEDITTIGSNAFCNRPELVNYTIPEGVTILTNPSYPNIGDNTFSQCANLETIVIPEGITVISNSAFVECPKLNNVTIPSTVTRIGDFAFKQTGLSEITIPANVTYIGEEAFAYNQNLATVISYITNPPAIDASVFAKESEFVNNAMVWKTYPQTLYVPKGSKAAYEAADYWKEFKEIKELASPLDMLVFTANPDGTTCSVTGHTEYCVRNVTIPESWEGLSVTTIGKDAFRSCNGLTSVTIPSSVTSIGDNAFAFCSGLTSITIPSSVTSIGVGDYFTAFTGCSNLSSLNVEAGNTKYDSRENCNAIIETGTNTLIIGTKNTIIPNSVTSIGANAFMDCGITSVTIPSSVTSIGDNALNNCSGLTSITIPSSVTSIGVGVFDGCSNLSSLRVESGNTKYDSRENCNAIIETGTNTLIIGTNNTIIPNSVTSIYQHAFKGCRGLTSVSIPNSVTSIDMFAFFECSNLISVTIPNSVTSIGAMAFGACSSLTSITIPNSVTSIGEFAFLSCSNLTSVTVEAKTPIIIGDIFANKANATLYVPAGCKAAYEAADYWKEFSNIVEATVTTVSAKSYSKTYGEANPTFESEVTGGTVTGTPEFTCTASATSNVGTYAIVITKGTITDPTVQYVNGTLTITKAPLKITAGSYTKKQGEANPAFSVSYDGFKNNETTSVLTTQPTISCTATESSPAGTYDIVVSGASAANYEISYVAGTLKVVEKDAPKIKLSKTKATIEKGKTLTLKATFTPSDFSDKSVTWKSSDTKVATVSSAGVVKGVKAGTATITCTSKATGAKATCKVTIGYVKLDKTTATIKKGKTLTLTATVYPTSLKDQTVTWASSDTKVTTVSSSGKVKGVKAGTATITCTSNATGLKTTCKVTVGYVKLDKTEATLEKGKTLTLTATVYPSSLSDRSVTWKSSKTSVATVSSSGKVKGVKAGTATITCTSNATGLKTTCTVNVVKGTVTLNKTEAYIEKGKTTTLKATLTPTTLTDKSVTWTSSDKSIATVSSSGKVKGVGYGTATITCTSNATGASATCQVTIGKVVISMSDFSLKKTRTTALTATLYPTTLTDKSVTWTSSDKSIATVSSSGKVKGIKAGTATITCTSVATGLKGNCKVTVLAVAEARSAIGDDDGTTGIEDLDERPAVEEDPYDVYDLSGRKVANQVTSLDGLPNGIYIVNGKKVMKK
jgi:uncharacterized protein YjdB